MYWKFFKRYGAMTHYLKTNEFFHTFSFFDFPFSFKLFLKKKRNSFFFSFKKKGKSIIGFPKKEKWKMKGKSFVKTPFI